jgi:hypothetical protein
MQAKMVDGSGLRGYNPSEQGSLGFSDYPGFIMALQWHGSTKPIRIWNSLMTLNAHAGGNDNDPRNIEIGPHTPRLGYFIIRSSDGLPLETSETTFEPAFRPPFDGRTFVALDGLYGYMELYRTPTPKRKVYQRGWGQNSHDGTIAVLNNRIIQNDKAPVPPLV